MDEPTTPTAKPWWQSKTVWLNVLALLSMAVPAVREWVEKNPVEPMAVLSALNLLVRFVTSGKISIFGDDDDSLSGEGSTGASAPGGKAGRDAGFMSNSRTRRSGIPWLVGPACVLLLVLPSCTVGVDAEGGWSIKPDPYSVDAVLRHAIRHEDDSAKSGLRRTPAAKVVVESAK
jgi:hypothetical protein